MVLLLPATRYQEPGPGYTGIPAYVINHPLASNKEELDHDASEEATTLFYVALLLKQLYSTTIQI